MNRNYKLSLADGAPLAFVQFPRKRFSTSRCRRSFKASKRMVSITSLTKANISNRRLAHRDTTLPHIEESAFIELPHRSAVTALHVICINLQLRLGVHMCISGGTKDCGWSVANWCAVRQGALKPDRQRHLQPARQGHTYKAHCWYSWARHGRLSYDCPHADSCLQWPYRTDSAPHVHRQASHGLYSV